MILECRYPTELLLVRSAAYGRMRPGRCVSSIYAEALGCRADVTYHLDSQCTGRPKCSLLVAAIDSIQQPCAKDFKMYLEVDYDCVQVSYLTDCRHGNTTIVTQSFGYLALLPGLEARSPWQPSQQQQHQYPSPRICSWTIVTERGRELAVTWKAPRGERRLVPSNGRQGDGHQGDGRYDQHPSPHLCPIVLAFWDGREEMVRPVCVGGSPPSSVPQEKDPSAQDPVLYSSRVGWIEVRTTISDWSSLGPPSRKPMILQYQVLGCADVVVDDGTAASVSRQGSDVTVDCPSTQEKWYLRCQDGVWIGELGNCSAIDQGQRSSEAAVTFSVYDDLRNGIIVSILIGIVLGIVTGSALMVMVHLLKSRNKRRLIFKKRELISTSCRHKMSPTAVPGCSNIDSSSSASHCRLTQFPNPPTDSAYVCSCAPSFGFRSDYNISRVSECLLRGREVEEPSDVTRCDLLASSLSGDEYSRAKDEAHVLMSVCSVHSIT